MKRKICSIVLMLAMVFSLMIPALATEPPIPSSGKVIVWSDAARVGKDETAVVDFYALYDENSYCGVDSIGFCLQASKVLTAVKGSAEGIGFQMGFAPQKFWNEGVGNLAGAGGAAGEDAYGVKITFPKVPETTPLSVTTVQLFRVIDKNDPEIETLLPPESITTDVGAVIVQYPITVNVGAGGKVAIKTTDYMTANPTPVSHTTYDEDGTSADVATGDKIWVDSGAGQQNRAIFSITPDTNYSIKDILVDNVSVGAGAVLTANQNGFYETSSITKATSIKFQFEKTVSFVDTTVKTYTNGTAAISKTGGVISYNGSELDAEDQVEVTTTGNQIFTITPSTGYQIKKVTVDGTEITSLAGKRDERTVPLNVTDLKVDHEIVVEYEKSIYSITTTVEPSGDGTITGPATVEHGKNAVYSFTPKNTTVEVKEVWVDGVKLTNPSLTGYTFTNVTSNHTLKVVFGASIGEMIIDPDSGLTMDGDKAVVVLRGEWAAEKTFNDMLSSVKINGGLTAVTDQTVTLSVGSATAYDFPASVKPVELDTSTFGKVNVLQSGIVEVTVRAKADTTKFVTFVFIVPGDVTRDGSVLPDDASMCFEVFGMDKDIEDLGDYAMELADMTQDGAILPDDASICLEIFGMDKEI